MRLLYSLGVLAALIFAGYYVSHEGLASGQKALLDQDLAALRSLREAVTRYGQAHGKYPENLAQVGPIPTLTIAALGDSSYGLHWHLTTRDVASMASLSRQPLDVEFRYRGRAGKVALVGDFNNYDLLRDPMNRDDADALDWRVHKTLEPGPYSFGFSIDGSQPRMTQADIRMSSHNDNFTARPTSLTDDGKWGYDPETGYVFIACTWTDRATGRALFSY